VRLFATKGDEEDSAPPSGDTSDTSGSDSGGADTGGGGTGGADTGQGDTGSGDTDSDTAPTDTAPTDTATDTDHDTGSDTGPPPDPVETLVGEVDAVFADLAISPDGTRLYATRVFHSDLLVLDTSDLHVIASVAVRGDPEGVRLSTDGTRALVALNASPGALAIVDVDPASRTAHSVLTTLTLGGNGSLGVGVHPDGDLAVALTQRPEPGTLAFVDLPTRTVTDQLSPTASGSAPLLVDAVFTPDGAKGYVSVFQSAAASNVLTFDPVGVAMRGAIDLGLPHAGGGPGDMVVAEAAGGTTLWVANNSWSGEGLTVVDTASDAVLAHLELGSTSGNIPGVCARPDGSQVIAAVAGLPLLGFDTTLLAQTHERAERLTHYDCIVSPLDDFLYVSTTTGEILKVDLRMMVASGSR
jgi:YVTN family beta-propeller protein